jgi:hypothetical protein
MAMDGLISFIIEISVLKQGIPSLFAKARKHLPSDLQFLLHKIAPDLQIHTLLSWIAWHSQIFESGKEYVFGMKLSISKGALMSLTVDPRFY